MVETAVRCAGLGKIYRKSAAPWRSLRRLLGAAPAEPDVWAVRDLNLEVPRGAVFGLVGRNGAGKSTTLKMIAGRLRPTVGELEVRGSVSSILELGTGLNPNLTGRQNARVSALFLGLDPWQIETQLERVLAFAELGNYVDEPLAHYSSGMRARLAFAVLTALRPDILVLDEALAAGDTAFAAKCQRFVRDLCSSGCTTLLVSHDLHFLESSCDVIAWIDQGTCRLVGPPSKVVEEYLRATVGGEVQARRPRRLHLRITAPSATEASLFCAQTLAGDGTPLTGLDLGRLDAWQHAMELAADVGLTTAAATRGWGDAVPVANSPQQMRLLRLRPAEAAHLVVPIAGSGELPRQVRLAGHFGPVALQVSAIVDGTPVVLGQVGGPDAPTHVDLPLGALLATPAA